MKKTLICALGAMLLGVTSVPTATAATVAQRLAAIQSGLAHLATLACTNTSSTRFGAIEVNGVCGNGNEDAYTGQALYAFLVNQSNWPSAQQAAYQTLVNNMVAYLVSVASTTPVSVNDGHENICPGGSGTCTAIYWNVCGDSTYCTGFVAPAIDSYIITVGAGTVLTTSGPLANMTGLQIAQGITNAWAAGQASAVDGTQEGGWHYTIPSNSSADMSTAQWGPLSLGFDELVGAVTPGVVKVHIPKWLAYDAQAGPACYEGGSSCGIGPDNSENGGWTVSNSYAGGAPKTAVISFLNTNWKTAANNEWYGNFGHPYAMWATYKGIGAVYGVKDTTHITNLLTDCGVSAGNGPGPTSQGGGACTWWEDYNEWLVNGASFSALPNTEYVADGAGNKYWTGYSNWIDPLSTGIYLAILAPAPIPNTISQGTPSSVPAVSRWGLVMLAILLVTFAAMKLRGPQTA
jgi:hypothetical protein